MGTRSIEAVKGMRVTPIWGAYHLPAALAPKISADVTWSIYPTHVLIKMKRAYMR